QKLIENLKHHCAQRSTGFQLHIDLHEVETQLLNISLLPPMELPGLRRRVPHTLRNLLPPLRGARPSRWLHVTLADCIQFSLSAMTSLLFSSLAPSRHGNLLGLLKSGGVPSSSNRWHHPDASAALSAGASDAGTFSCGLQQTPVPLQHSTSLYDAAHTGPEDSSTSHHR